MSKMFPQLDVVSIRMSEPARERHLAAVREALSAQGPSKRRFRLLAVAVATLFLLPVLALAAQDAQPGDFLYPVRQVLPWTDRVESDVSAVDQPAVPADPISDIVEEPAPEPAHPDRVIRDDQVQVTDSEPASDALREEDRARDSHDRATTTETTLAPDRTRDRP